MRHRAVLVSILAVLMAAASPAWSATDTFVDDDGSVFEPSIEAIAAAGLTRGCDPPAGDRYCPDRLVTRAEFATFLVRALERSGPVPAGEDAFVDDEGSVHESSIDRLAALGVTRGCGGGPLTGAGPGPVTTPDVSPGGQLTDVRVGSHAGYERVVFEFEDVTSFDPNLDPVWPGYTVELVDVPVISDPSGQVVELEGDQAIVIRFAFASQFDLEGRRIYFGPSRFTVRLGTIREVVLTGDFERVLGWAIGVDGSPEFRVTTLDDPARVVVDVPTPPRFCPDEPVTRGQLAALFTRAFGYRDPDPAVDRFADDDGSVFEADIEALAGAGVTTGCDPPGNDRYCPDDPVTRGQMAAFLQRALGLEPMAG
jgi:hypothetical protein